MPALYQDEHKTWPFLLEKKKAACLRGADSPAIGRCCWGSKAVSVLTLRWPSQGEHMEALENGSPKYKVGGGSIKSHLFLQLVMWGNPGSSHVRHQTTWPHREMELNTICRSGQSHDKRSEIPPHVLLGDCIQPKLGLCPLSEKGWVLPQAPALWSCSAFDIYGLRNKVPVCASFCTRHWTCGFLIHWVIWSFQGGSFPFTGKFPTAWACVTATAGLSNSAGSAWNNRIANMDRHSTGTNLLFPETMFLLNFC